MTRNWLFEVIRSCDYEIQGEVRLHGPLPVQEVRSKVTGNLVEYLNEGAGCALSFARFSNAEMAPYKSYKSLGERTRVLRQMDLLGTSDLRQVSKELNVSISSLSRFLKERKRLASLAKYKHSKKASKAVEKKLRVANSQGEDAASVCVRKRVRFECDDKDVPAVARAEETPVQQQVDSEEHVPFFTCKMADEDIQDILPASEVLRAPVLEQERAPSVTWKGMSEERKQRNVSSKPRYTVEPTKQEITSALSVLRRAVESDFRRPLWCEFVSGRLQEQIPRPTMVGGPWGWEVAEAVGTINAAFRADSGSTMWLKFALKNLL